MKNSILKFLHVLCFFIMFEPISAAHNNTQPQTGWFKWSVIIGTAATAAWTAYSYFTLSQELAALKKVARENRQAQQQIHAANEQLRLAMENAAHAPEGTSVQRTTQALQAGADPNIRIRCLGQLSMPALWFAVNAAKPQLVTTLINARADVNAAIDNRILHVHSQPDKFIQDSNFFGAGPILFYAIWQENLSQELDAQNAADGYFNIAKLLIEKGAHCPPDLPTYLRPQLPDTRQQSNNAGPNYILTQHSAISDRMSRFLIERQPKPMQERYAVLLAAPPVYRNEESTKDTSGWFRKKEPQN